MLFATALRIPYRMSTRRSLIPFSRANWTKSVCSTSIMPSRICRTPEPTATISSVSTGRMRMLGVLSGDAPGATRDTGGSRCSMVKKM